MNVGILTEGKCEIIPLNQILSNLNIDTVQIIQPLHISVDPKASAGQIAKSAESRLKILFEYKKVDKIIILIDFEDKKGCPGEWAKEIEDAIIKKGYKNVYVVIKNMFFENWLVADTEALSKSPKRFKSDKGFIKKISPNKADSVDALKMIKGICIKKSYDKNRDPLIVSKFCNPLNIAKNSRSFRKLLRLLNHPDYSEQSLNPN